MAVPKGIALLDRRTLQRLVGSPAPAPHFGALEPVPPETPLESAQPPWWHRLTALSPQHLAWLAAGEAVVGVDEAGRGPLAGPVVVAAVTLPAARWPQGLRDSKRLSAPERHRLALELLKEPGGALEIAVAVASVALIDRVNILQATRLAMGQTLSALASPPGLALVDGPFAASGAPTGIAQYPVIDGDDLCPPVSAASVIAKVVRDALMARLDRRYPGYGFARHKGYATPAHRQALQALGPCPVHRRSFLPVRLAEGLSVLEQPQLPGVANAGERGTGP